MEVNLKSAFINGLFICIGLTMLGLTIGSSAIRYKEYERFVSVKGLSEKDVPADTAIWPIQFTGADNDLEALYAKLEKDAGKVVKLLKENGFEESEITVAPPAVTDKLASEYGGDSKAAMRYTANQVITVYSKKVDAVRSTTKKLSMLGKDGVAIKGPGYDEANKTEFIFSGLNNIKPQMIEEATQKAREVADKFASDSHSQLGKIKSANQGQFTITDRDKSTPYIKTVRVVSTVEYYLSD